MNDIEAICVQRDVRLERHEYASNNYLAKSKKANDFECQCKIDICTCKRITRKERYYNSSRQVYRAQRYTPRAFTDVGVGSVKTVYKKRVKRIYLPETEETGVGSSEYSFAQRPITKPNCEGCCIYNKKTSSKCVGDAKESFNVPVLSKKLSPMVKTVSGSTSPKLTNLEHSDTSSYNEKYIRSREKLQMVNTQQRVEDCSLAKDQVETFLVNIASKITSPANKVTRSIGTNVAEGKNYSSDSLIQHVHNLENPSKEKLRTSIDFIENKLEREYRKIFTTDKKDVDSNSNVTQMPELKSASLLRRRFEALRRGLNKKEKQEVSIKISSKLSVPSKKDVSIASDPPSLESRSYSNTKVYSPVVSTLKARGSPSRGKSYLDEAEVISNFPDEAVDSNCDDVKDMFKLWGTKFDLEEDSYRATQKKHKKKVEITLPKEKSSKKEKRKRFSFFGKKNKNKSKETYGHKQGVTAGRCELGDGLMIKIGAVNKYEPVIPIEKIDYSTDNITEKDWLKRFLSKKIDSRNSIRLRWNNTMYAASSSTVFELMDCVYKNTGVMFSSKSEVTTGGSSNYYSYENPRVNFMQQNIQAWMIPKTFTDKQITDTSFNKLYPKKFTNENIELILSNQKWLIEKSKGFSKNVELVLHSKNLVKHKESSEYIVIDIPKGYFSDTSSDDKNNHTSDEQVYNIVEYESLNSSNYLNKREAENEIESGDYKPKDIQVTIHVRDDDESELKALNSNMKRQEDNTIVDDSNGYMPKARDVISVRIITQRDIRDIRKPILKIRDNISDKSVHVLPPPRKCELAESFLQDYYRNLTPLGIDLISWCVSNDKLNRSSDSNSFRSFKNQGDGSKSCSNICDGYQASTIVSSCETSSCGHCKVVEEEKKVDDSRTSTFFGKLMKRTFEPTAVDTPIKRTSAKDSLEVFKRRKIYATSNKSKWGVNDDRSEPYFLPEKTQNSSNECPKVEQTGSHTRETPKKRCKKRVLLQDCDVMDDILKEQLSDKMVEGILSFKGTSGCNSCKSQKPEHTKQAQVIPKPICEIPQTPCKESCLKEKKPPCSKKNSPSCNVPAPAPCPAGPPSPCQKPCPPSPPPCQLSSPCAKISVHKSTSRSSPSSSVTPSSRKPIPPRIHSPKLSSPIRSRACICPKNQSTCNIPKCPVSKKSSCVSTPPHLPKSISHDSPTKCRSQSPIKSPCNSCQKCKKSSSHDFPWPLKNQRSNSPSKESGLSLKLTPPLCTTKKSSSKCLDAFRRLIQKVSSSSLKQKECKPDCANKRKIITPPSPPAPPPTLVSVPSPPSPNNCRSKMLGLHLKKLPMPKSCSKECLSCDESHGVIRLNSREKILIKVKQSTPSTEEIREGCNIKVQDEDGQTLYERRDYRKIDKNRMHFVKDMYRESQVQRISTPDTDKVLDKTPLKINKCKSDSSLSIIEINLNLKFRQGDKATNINKSKSTDTIAKEPNSSQVNVQRKQSKEIYVVEDKTKFMNEVLDKRDVNIKIVINNYKEPSKLITNNRSVNLSAEEFSKNISDKFNTVSTGYSDIIERQTYSIHRATIDLTTSNNSIHKCSTKSSVKDTLDKNGFNECINETSVIDAITKSYIISNKDKKSKHIFKTNTTSVENTEVTNDDKSATSISIANTDENIHSDNTCSDDKNNFPHRKYNKEEKIKILKQIFETASEIKRRNNKGEIHEIRHLLRAVLTSDSSDQDITELNNNLAEELTYASLKPDFFKNSNSMTNYYLDKSSMSTKLSSKNESDVIYPTEENVSGCSSSTEVKENLGCLCSHLAKKLNITNNNAPKSPCCCGRIEKVDEEINCNIKDDEKLIIEVDTQYSEQLKSSMNLSVNKKTIDDNIENISSKRSFLNSNKYINKITESERQSVVECSNEDIGVKNLNLECDKITDNINDNSVNIKPADVLQCNETKKAVLEIYAEKVVSNKGNRIVAKLPKFICGQESKIYNFREIFTGYKKLGKK